MEVMKRSSKLKERVFERKICLKIWIQQIFYKFKVIGICIRISQIKILKNMVEYKF